MTRALSPATQLQDKLVGEAEISLRNGHNVMIDAPTGAGKSRMFSKIAAHAADDHETVIILSHRRNLVDGICDNIQKWTDKGCSCSKGMDGILDQSGQIVSSTVQTATERMDELKSYDKAIIDEAHHAKPDSDYSAILGVLFDKNPDMQVVAASATFPPDRNGLIKELQTAKRHVITFEEAISARLIDLPKTITPRVRLNGGKTVDSIMDDYAKDAIGRQSDESYAGLAARISKAQPDDWRETELYYYERYLADRKTIVFHDTVREAEEFTSLARESGHDIAALHSGNSSRENDRILHHFKNRDLKAIVSVDMVSEGFDVDARGILLLKKRTSNDEYRQLVGRASRSFGLPKNQRSLLVDLGASTRLHGDIVVQARVSQMRIEEGQKNALDLSPEKGDQNGMWRHVPDKDPDAWVTQIDGGFVYAIPNGPEYIAFESRVDKKGHKLEMLAIEGQKKGRPQKDSFVEWASERIRSNERTLARMISSDSVDNLEASINRDWEKHASTIKYACSQMRPQQITMQMAHAGGISR